MARFGDNDSGQRRSVTRPFDVGSVLGLLPRLASVSGRGRMYRDGYALILSAVATSAIGVVYWALAARLYPTRFVGLNSTAVSSMLLLSGVAQLNLMSALIRFTPRAGRNTMKLVAGVYLTIIAAGVAVGIVLTLVRGIWTPAPVLFDGDAANVFFWWFVISTIAWSIFALQDFVLTGLQRAIWVPIENVAFALIKVVLLVAFVQFQEYGIFLSWTIPTLAGIIVVNFFIFRYFVPGRVRAATEEPEEVTPRQFVRYVTWDYFGALCSLASTSLLPLLVTHEVGADNAAYFYLAWIFAYGVHLVSLNLAASFTVEASKDERGLYALGTHVLWHMARLVVPLTIIVCLAAPLLLRFFPAGYASNGTTTLRLLTLGAIPNMLTVLYIAMARVQRHTGLVFVLQASLCALVLGLSHIFLGIYGVQGVGLAWLVSQSVVALFLGATSLRPMFRRHSSGPRQTVTAHVKV